MECRTCLRKDQFLSVPIDTISEVSQEAVSLMLIYCCQLQISSADKLPQQICVECMSKLDQWYGFWKRCRHADITYRSKALQLEELMQHEITPAVGPLEVDPLSVEEEKNVEVNLASPVAVVSEGVPSDHEDVEPQPDQEQSYHCCFAGCGRVYASMEQLEGHASEEHWLKRRDFQKKRKLNHLYSCSVCLCGFTSQAGWEFHKLLLFGQRTKNPHDKTIEGENESSEAESDGFMVTVASESDNLMKTALENRLENVFKRSRETGKHFVVKISAEELKLLKENRDHFLLKMSRLSLKRCSKQLRIVYVCLTCRTRVTNGYRMNLHVDKGKCGGYFGALESYEMATRNFRCNDCDYESNRLPNMKRHTQKKGHSGCTEVFPSSATEQEPNKPTATQEEATPLTSGQATQVENCHICTHCGKLSETEYNHNRHLSYFCPVLHPSKLSFKYSCKNCKKGFNSQLVLDRHQENVCSATSVKDPVESVPPITRCDHCNKVFTSAARLNRHRTLCTLRHEQGTREYRCPKCARCFWKLYNLTAHLETCSKKVATPPSNNPVIAKDASDASQNQRPKINWRCPDCNQSFNRKPLLQKHRQTGTCSELIERPRIRLPRGVTGNTTCKYCKRKFSKPSNMYRHVRDGCASLVRTKGDDGGAADGDDDYGTDEPLVGEVEVMKIEIVENFP